jgi:serine/threonine protein kinase
MSKLLEQASTAAGARGRRHERNADGRSPRPGASSDTAFGSYRLQRRIGRGGMAEVWRAEWRRSDGTRERVALKRILPGLCERRDVLDMFLTEARLAMRLAHPKIVRTVDAGEVEGQPYLAMELIAGIDLNALWRAAPDPLPIGFVVSVVKDICRALGYVHRLRDEHDVPLGLVHRDVSPSNVMMARDGSVKLLDFGVAKALGVATLDVTRAGVLKGKFGYMAPEQIRGKGYDQRADVFAAGVVLHELLANRRLFKAEDEYVTLALNHACKIAPPSAQNPAVPSSLDRVAMRALAKHPEDRYANADEMAHELRRALDDFPCSQKDAAAVVRERAHRIAARRRARKGVPRRSEAPTKVPSGDEPVVLAPATSVSRVQTAVRMVAGGRALPESPSLRQLLAGLILSLLFATHARFATLRTAPAPQSRSEHSKPANPQRMGEREWSQRSTSLAVASRGARRCSSA